ncbi:MAG: hypothetical protein ACREIC_16475, partial [Limisphaerales bacterium]
MYQGYASRFFFVRVADVWYVMFGPSGVGFHDSLGVRSDSAIRVHDDHWDGRTNHEARPLMRIAPATISQGS